MAERMTKTTGKSYKGIITIVVLADENPDSINSLLINIKNGGYVYVPVTGKIGNIASPYAVFNMSADTAKKLCGRYQQTSFVFSKLNEDGMIHSEYYEKQDPTIPQKRQTNEYIKKDECDTWEDMPNADNNFTVNGKEFKYSIPFEKFKTVNETISENLHRIVSIEKERGNNTINEEKALIYTIDGVGQSPYLWRKAMTKGL